MSLFYRLGSSWLMIPQHQLRRRNVYQPVTQVYRRSSLSTATAWSTNADEMDNENLDDDDVEEELRVDQDSLTSSNINNNSDNNNYNHHHPMQHRNRPTYYSSTQSTVQSVDWFASYSNSNNHQDLMEPTIPYPTPPNPTNYTDSGATQLPAINSSTTYISPYPLKTTETTVTTLPTTTVVSESVTTATAEQPIKITSSSSVDDGPTLLHPQDFYELDERSGQYRIPSPKSLSPSAIKEFLACPQSFFFQYILGLRQPNTPILAKGTMCHAALERVFDLEPHQRTLEVLQNLFRTVWSEHRTMDSYRDLFRGSIPQEQQWGMEGLQLLQNYWLCEDASSVVRPNPVQREIWVRARLNRDPQKGVTAASNHRPFNVTDPSTTAFHHTQIGTKRHNISSSNKQQEQNVDDFLVRGIVDRLDLVRSTDDGTVCLRLIDYKTGKKPDLKYSPSMNAKIQREAMEQLIIYALLLREANKDKATPLPIRYLRLFYLTSVQEKADYMELDLGATQEERDQLLQSVHATLAQVWTDIENLVAAQDALQFHGCERSFCYCHTCRKRFVPGTVWEP